MIATECHEMQRATWTRRLTGLFFLLLLASTWRLWIPRQNIPGFPAFSIAADVPEFFDWILLFCIVASCIVWTLSNKQARLSACLFLPALALLLLFDQLRWQPWALQVWLFVAVLTLALPHDALRLLRWLTIGIYFHAAIAKLDYDFAQTFGQQFLGAILGSVGVQLETIPKHIRLPLSLAFPIAELIVAGLLCFHRTARLGVIAAVVMHLTTIAILGPLGLSHAWGVLVWNMWLAIQTPILFWPLRDAQVAPEIPPWVSAWRRWLATGLVLAAILLPFTTRYGYWDTWPSWGLYAPGAERTTVWIHELGVEKLPPALVPYVRGEQTWRLLQLDRWALEQLTAPLYPQNRVRVGVANYVASQYQLGDLIRVETESPSDRFAGKREDRTLDDQRAITEQAKTYWLNAASLR